MDISLLPVVATFVFLLLTVFVISFALLFQKRQLDNFKEKQALKSVYEREILQTQIEIQNQTLRQVSQELHDHIGQLLSLVTLHLNVLEEDLVSTPHQSSVQRSLEVLNTAIQDVRSLSRSLDDNTVQEYGLHQSLQLELKRIERTKRFITHLHLIGKPYVLDRQTETVLFRMAQEALNNAIKHSGSGTLTATTDYQPNQFVLTIADNGKGFSVKEALGRDIDHAGSGLRNLQRRAKLLGGSCSIMSQPNQGTRIEISVPTSGSNLASP